ncbi:MAG: SOS response-associated peptidase [Alphaproteobacteria bacterium]
MCGRYSVTLPPEAMAKLFRAIGALPNFPPRYNAAPGQPLPVIRRAPDGRRELTLARWGLIPSWSKGPDSRYSMINARADTVAEKPAYRGPFRHRRCLVPADGFYEWREAGKGGKQPYYFSLKSRETFAFAALWDRWVSAQGDEVDSFAIIVTDANACVAPVHDRMPVILPPDAYAVWLGEEEAAASRLTALLGPAPAESMQAWTVSRDVNRPANDRPDLIAPFCESQSNPTLL